jgi:hypothetical protein
MKLSGNSWLYILIMIFMMAVFGVSLSMKYTASKLLPMIVSGIVFVSAAMGLKEDISAAAKANTDSTEGKVGKKKTSKMDWHGNIVQTSWVAAFFLSIYFFGFLISIPVFVLAYMKTFGTRWLVAIIFAVLTPAIIYVVFERAMGVDLYRGALFEWLGY